MTCHICGATHYGSGRGCPYVELGIIPGWVEPERIQAMRLAIQAHYAKGKVGAPRCRPANSAHDAEAGR